jgi:hypothetical protein
MSNEEEESKKTESELGLDLDLHFLPSWAQQPSVNQYEKFSGQEGRDAGRERRGGDRGDRGPRRFDRPRPPGGGVSGMQPGGRPPQRGSRPEGRGPDRRGDMRDRGPRRGGPGGRPGGDRPEIKLPELEVTFFPEEKGVESLARQIKLSGRAYPLFEIAYLVLKKPERYHVQLTAKKKEDGQPVQPLYICGLDDTLWLDENEAMRHVLDKHFGTFYASERIPTDPPKGVYTFVAQCGMSGTILGPPNYHDYQNKLRKLHQERFARMPFDMFKARIRIVKDEAVVKKWLEDQSFRTEYTCLNIPETIKLNSREDVEKHFRETHLANVIKSVANYTMAGTAVANIENRALHSLIRRSYDEQMRFPLKVVNILSGQFARQGLQFFKVNKSVTHVAVARPHYLDLEAVSVSDGIKRIVEFIDSHPRTTRKKLVDALAPGAGQAVPAAPVAAAAPAESSQAAPEGAAAVAPAAPVASPEASAAISDLHWLVHQGHVIEFANGILETAKKPLPRPPKPERKQKPDQPAEVPTAPAEAEVTTQDGIAPGQGADAEAAGAPTDAELPETSAAVQDESGTSAGAAVPGTPEFPPSQGSPAHPAEPVVSGHSSELSVSPEQKTPDQQT